MASTASDYDVLVTWTMIIKDHIKSGNLDSAKQILTCEMRSAGVTPDVYAYSLLVKAFLDKGCESDVQDLLKDMQSHEIYPDVIIYACLCKYYVDIRQLDYALELFNKMLAGGIKPNEYVMNILYYGFLKERPVADAEKFLNEMQQEYNLRSSNITTALLQKLLFRKK